MNCEECTQKQANVFCSECEQKLCTACDQVIHRGGKRKTHSRPPICACGAASQQFCDSCGVALCSICQEKHATHSLQALGSRVAVFWDLSSCSPLRPEDISGIVTHIQARYPGLSFIKAYGDMFLKWLDTFTACSVELRVCEGLRELEALMLDMSMTGAKGVTHILLLSGKAVQIRPHLAQLQSNLPVTIHVSPTLVPLNPVSLEMLPRENFAASRTSIPSVRPTIRNSYSELRGNKSGQQLVILEGCPVYQRFFNKSGQESSHNMLLTLLKEFADRGMLMHEANWLLSYLQTRTSLKQEKARSILNSGQELGILHVSERKFGTLKQVCFVSMRLDSLSLESLLWTLRSLKIDEMLPTERAIQSRMKEVFDFKPSNTQWQNLLDACRGSSKEKHHHTRSAPTTGPQLSFSLFSHQQVDSEPLFSTSLIPEFTVKEITDPVTGAETYAIYPKDEDWESVDQYIKEGDVLGLKRSAEWKTFLNFLDGYFRGPGETIDESKAIAGGRYGCAQFLKMCGPTALTQSSLGKLSYMVQLAINEDLLRYQKTLLVWTAGAVKKPNDPETETKLKSVQRSIIEVLKESRGGMSLAQLPLYLKRKLSFPLDLGELGFAKLKDLLTTMPDVDVEQRGTNHPFAVLKNRKKKSSDEKEILKAISEILKENKQGLPGTKVEQLLSSKLGYSVNWGEFKCSSIYEFSQRFGSRNLEVVGSGDSKILTTRKSYSEYYTPFKDTYQTTHLIPPNPGSDYFQGSLFYLHPPPQKVVNVSNLPAGFAESGPQSTLDTEHEERQKRFIEQLLCEGEESISDSLQGPFPPHHRTDSVEYHTDEPQFNTSPPPGFC